MCVCVCADERKSSDTHTHTHNNIITLCSIATESGILYYIGSLVSRARVNALENILSLSDYVAYYNKI